MVDGGCRDSELSARMLEAMSDSTDVIVRAFHSSGDAEEWLRNPVRYDAVMHFPPRNPSLMFPGFAQSYFFDQRSRTPQLPMTDCGMQKRAH